MFNAKNLVRTGEGRVQLPSMPFSGLVSELTKSGFAFDGVTTTHSANQNQSRLILGKTGNDGFIDYTKPYVSVRLSEKLKLKAIDDAGIFNEAYENYPVFFGTSKITSTPEEIEAGAPEIREVNWVTLAPAGEYVPKQASKIDVAALLKGTVAGMPNSNK